MSIESELRAKAERIAFRLQNQDARLEREQLELQQKMADIQAKRDAARVASKRLANYAVKLGIDYQCPRCWVEFEARSALTPRPTDELVCDSCHSGFQV